MRVWGGTEPISLSNQNSVQILGEIIRIIFAFCRNSSEIQTIKETLTKEFGEILSIFHQDQCNIRPKLLKVTKV